MYAIPDRIADRYELTDPISTGGMGQVFRGYDTVLDRPVAVKVIRPDLVTRPDKYPELAARFRREARVTARIEHPNVPAVYDAAVDTDQGMLYLVMQLVRGEPLADLIAEQKPLPIATVAAVAAQMCAALSYAHAVPVVHRDLKPGNVMIADDGTVKVLDFGIAAVLRTDMTRITVTGTQLGTCAYMPPEQISGGGVNPRSDLYSLGCVLFEMLTGRTVFPPEYGPLQQQNAHAYEVPSPPSLLVSGLPEDLDRLVMDLLAKDPEARPASAQDVHDRLVPHLPLPDPTAPDKPLPPGGMPDPTRPYRRPMAPRPRKPVEKPTRPLPPTLVEPTDRFIPGLDPGALSEADAHAQSLIADERYAQAVGVLDEVIDPAASALGTESDQVVELRLLRATALVFGGDAGRALPEFTALADVLERQAGRDDPRALLCRQQAAYCLALLGETTRALRAGEELLVRIREVGGDRSEDALDLRQAIAMWRLRSGDTERAARELGGLYDDLRAEYGPQAPETLQVAELMARLSRRDRP
ncbi:serine/threonine-protein kinase [Nocardiopsis lambiniae]|uniref:non-specific serine/threonine protein kinase n=1 Tax=Nocardiopsis lambiniae TaxID=3075539 RepID=A0ABU2MBF8_9ACTN|nr:serine/threonine-protein kinase [Nocardiopsis sp. DSM 44743]MDT0330018.1 serine/threonine-protein kinase [Nocardiopsis sp. DSM 44743]